MDLQLPLSRAFGKEAANPGADVFESVESDAANNGDAQSVRLATPVIKAPVTVCRINEPPGP